MSYHAINEKCQTVGIDRDETKLSPFDLWTVLLVGQICFAN